MATPECNMCPDHDVEIRDPVHDELAFQSALVHANVLPWTPLLPFSFVESSRGPRVPRHTAMASSACRCTKMGAPVLEDVLWAFSVRACAWPVAVATAVVDDQRDLPT